MANPVTSTAVPKATSQRDIDHAKLIAANDVRHKVAVPAAITRLAATRLAAPVVARPQAAAPAKPAAPVPVAPNPASYTNADGSVSTGQSAIDMAKQTLSSWGLSSLAPTLGKLLASGTQNGDELSLALQQTPEYQQRFSGNAARVKQGLPALSPAQYLSAEESYHNIMQSAGLPAGFYSSQQALAGFIGNDISPTELQSRVDVATQTWQNADQAHKDAWQQYYGLDAGHAVAGILDQSTALPLLQQHAQAVNIGAAASEQGVATPTATRAEQFAQFGVTTAQAQQAYSNIAQYGQAQTAIGQRAGLDTGQATQENASLLNDGTAQRDIATANAGETADFAGHAAADTNSVAASAAY